MIARPLLFGLAGASIGLAGLAIAPPAIVVCARKPEGERYRIPERLRAGGSLQSRQSWASRAKSFETVGRTGINSCSAVGPGGSSGCLQRIINQARDERAEDTAADTAPKQ